MKAIVLGLAFVVASATTAGAFQCPSLQAQIDKAFGKRFDKGATEARAMARQAEALHKSGKHAESVKMYQAAAKAGGLDLMTKK